MRALKQLTAALLASLALAGCSTQTPPPDIQASRNPVNPSPGLAPARSNVIQGYAHRTPVEPQGWEEPAPKPPAGGSGS